MVFPQNGGHGVPYHQAYTYGMELQPQRQPIMQLGYVPSNPAMNAGYVHHGLGYGPVDVGQPGMPMHTEDYGAHGMWQPPHAPRMTAAAAAYGHRYGHAQVAPNSVMQPWQAGPMHMAQQQQPHMHQQIEHQLILHQHLAKLQDHRQSQYGHAPPRAAFQQQQQQPHPQHDQYHAYHGQDRQYDASAGGRQDGWVDRRAAQVESHDYVGQAIRRAEANRAAQEWHEGPSNAWKKSSMHQVHGYPAQRHEQQLGYPLFDDSRPGFGAWNQPSNATYQTAHQQQQLPERQSQQWFDGREASHGGAWCDDRARRHSDEYDLHGAAAARNASFTNQWSHGHANHQEYAAQGPGFGDWRFTQHARGHHQAHYHQQDFDQAAPSSHYVVRAGDQATLAAATHVAAPQEASHQGHNAVASQASPPSTEAPAAESKGPAPPSPDTLDKSSVPIAAFGAQVIWNACAAFFDPDLLRQAQIETESKHIWNAEEAASGSSGSLSAPSSSSTPCISTPSLSPWASGIIGKSTDSEWSAFRSPFGPDKLAHLRGQHHDPSSVLNSDSVSSLHRLAVGARGLSRAPRSPGRISSLSRSRGTSGNLGFSYPDGGAGHSSGGSSSGSSEPGTPSSMGSSSPLRSTDHLARSDSAVHTSTRATIGFGLDRSNSESALPPHLKVRKSSSSTRWADRARENILSALSLTSPEGPWSANSYKLVSLHPPETLRRNSSTRKSNGLDNSSLRSRSPRDSTAGAASAHASDASPALRRFAHQVLSQTLLSPTAFLLGIMYALRLPYLARQDDGSIEPEAIELFAQPTSAAPFKLFTLGMMIANKHLDDNTFTNKTWNEVTGIPLAELNQIEAYFLRKCDYEVTVPTETWISFLQNIKARTAAAARNSEKQFKAADSNESDSHKLFREKAQSLSAGDQDCSKRLLMILEEALTALDVFPQFALDSCSPMQVTADDRESASPPFVKKEWGRMKQDRPTSTLQSQHQHCHSAPSLSLGLGSDDDVFDDEHSPFRPNPNRRSGNDEHTTALSRSHSDFSGRLSRVSTPSGPLVPSAHLQGGRTLLHGSAFVPLATSAWSQR